jgi:hypothetical protein
MMPLMEKQDQGSKLSRTEKKSQKGTTLFSLFYILGFSSVLYIPFHHSSVGYTHVIEEDEE